MANAVSQPYVTLEEYFALEEKSETKHEWLDGVVYAMSRGTPEHGRLVSRITRQLGNALEGQCEVYAADTLLYVAKTQLTTYADGFVVCGPLQTYRVAKLGEAVTNPTLIVEVLSDSTQVYDRTEKFAHYTQIPSLQEYVLVSQHERRIEVFRRPQRGHWIHEMAQAGQSLTLHGHVIQVDSVYG